MEELYGSRLRQTELGDFRQRIKEPGLLETSVREGDQRLQAMTDETRRRGRSAETSKPRNLFTN